MAHMHVSSWFLQTTTGSDPPTTSMVTGQPQDVPIPSTSTSTPATIPTIAADDTPPLEEDGGAVIEPGTEGASPVVLCDWLYGCPTGVASPTFTSTPWPCTALVTEPLLRVVVMMSDSGLMFEGDALASYSNTNCMFGGGRGGCDYGMIDMMDGMVWCGVHAHTTTTCVCEHETHSTTNHTPPHPLRSHQSYTQNPKRTRCVLFPCSNLRRVEGEGAPPTPVFTYTSP